MKLELLALKWAVSEKFRGYLLGSKFTVVTDNNPLCHLNSAKLGAIEQRWVAQLAPFDFEVQYRPGQCNTAANTLSRQPLAGEPQPTGDEEEFDECISNCNLVSRGTTLGLDLVSAGVKCCQVRQARVTAVEQDTHFTDSQGNTPTLPGYSKEELRQFQSSDPTIKSFRQFWDKKKKPTYQQRKGLAKSVISLLRQWSRIIEIEGLLYRVIEDGHLGRCQQLLLPACLKEALKSVHDQMGHQGVEQTQNLLRQRCFWVGMYEEVDQWIKKCYRCVLTKLPQPKIHAPVKPFLATRPLEVVAYHSPGKLICRSDLFITMKLTALILLWALSSTAGALQCQTCTNQTCSSTVTVNCSSETMCVTATILAKSSGTTATQIYKACASSSLCPATGNQTFSVDLGVESVLASAMCCNTDNCNSQNLPAPTPQSSNGLQCNACATSKCNTPLQCQGVEDQCFQSMMRDGTNSFPAYGCASANLCAAASSLGSLPFMQMAGTITSGPNCTSRTTTAAPTTTTKAASTTTTAAPTTTTAAPTTTTPTTTTVAPTTTTTAPTTTTAAPTTTIVVDTRTTSAPTLTTAGALQCQTCTNQTCSSTVTVNCSSETMCVTATILATSSGTTATQFYKACASSSLCPATGNQTFSVNLGVQSVLASATCCNTDNCNSQNLPAPTPQSSNGLLCNTCVASQCNTTLQCQGVEDQCFQSMMRDGTNSFPAYGCASANLCAAASSLGSLPFMQMAGTITSGPNCTSRTTTAAPTTTTKAASTTTTAAPTTTTAAPTTTTPTTTTVAPNTTTTAPTTTTAAPTTTIVVDTRTTSAPTSTTAGALQCQTCTNQTCSSTVTVNCSSETMCVTATILATSSGTTATQFYKACASSSLCPATGNQTFSVNLGVQSVLASATCCNTDNCNSQNLPAPTPQSSNGLLCNTCVASQCNTTLQCQGVEDQCFQSMMRDGTNSFPAYGCASANLCAAASSLGSLPFMQMAGTITSGPNCTSRTTTAAPTTTTKAASTTTTAAPTTTTAAPTTTTPTTTTVAPNTTTTAPTTTTAAPTTTIVVDTRTTSAPTSTTAGALQCQTCTNQTCSSTVTVNCSSETMCVTATILATSSGTTATQFYKACASSSLCPATGNQTFSVNLGVQSVLASATCCNTDNCNSQNLPAPTPQSSNGLLCNTCVASQCNTTLQCQGVEDQCFQSMMRDGTNSFPAYGCASANLCAAASSLGSLPFMQMAGTITSGPNCTSRTTTAAPTTTTKAASTTTTAAPTTTTAAPTTTTPTTTTVAPTTTTTAPTTTTAAPTTTI
ncbi:unnamed protein product, partial [Oreochromis niloticus]